MTRDKPIGEAIWTRCPIPGTKDLARVDVTLLARSNRYYMARRLFSRSSKPFVVSERELEQIILK